MVCYFVGLRVPEKKTRRRTRHKRPSACASVLLRETREREQKELASTEERCCACFSGGPRSQSTCSQELRRTSRWQTLSGLCRLHHFCSTATPTVAVVKASRSLRSPLNTAVSSPPRLILRSTGQLAFSMHRPPRRTSLSRSEPSNQRK